MYIPLINPDITCNLAQKLHEGVRSDEKQRRVKRQDREKNSKGKRSIKQEGTSGWRVVPLPVASTVGFCPKIPTPVVHPTEPHFSLVATEMILQNFLD